MKRRIGRDISRSRLGVIIGGTAATAALGMALTLPSTGGSATTGARRFPASAANVSTPDNACGAPSPGVSPSASPSDDDDSEPSDSPSPGDDSSSDSKSSDSAPACGSPSPNGSPSPPLQPRQLRRTGLTPDQLRKSNELISTFENSTPNLDYGYAQNLHDGRGVTAGRAGFTTADGDALQVVQEYTDQNQNNPLAKFLDTMKQLANSGSEDTSGLPEDDYIAAWKEAANDPKFRQVQDDVSNKLYLDPAMSTAEKLGLQTPLAKAEIYDAIVEHGNGDDPDGLPALVKRADDDAGGTPADGVDEHKWLNSFFKVRIDDLQNPSNKDTQQEWSGSVDRVRSMQRLADAGDYNLSGQLHTSVFGDNFTIQ